MPDSSVQTRSLSAADSLMWRLENDPVLRSPILVVGLLDRAPKRKRLRATIDRASRLIPGLRHRIVSPPAGVGRHRWVPDDHFWLDHHLRWVGATGGGIRSVLDLAEPDVMTAFDPQRPMWSLTVVEGLDGGRAAFVLRMHHAIVDGVGGLRLAGAIFDATRRPADPSDDVDVVNGGTAAPPDASRPLGDRLAGGIDLLFDGTEGIVAAVRDPRGSIAGSLRMARSITRVLGRPPPGSPLLVGRGLDRRLHVIERPLADLREAAVAAGGTINDVLLAAVGRAFRAYRHHQQVSVPTMTVTMPVNLREEDEPPDGNRFAPTRFALPVDEPDPVIRTKVAGAIARSWHDEPALELSKVLAEGLNLLPGAVPARLFGALLRSVDVDVVDLPGLERPAYLGGARIDRMWAFAPPTGAAFSVSLLSHIDTCCVAVACDRAAVAQPELLASCLDSSFDEMVVPA